MGVLDILHSSVTTHWTGSIRDALIHRVSYLMEESAVSELFTRGLSLMISSLARVR